MKRRGADLVRKKRGMGSSGWMSRVVNYHERRHTEAYTSCCDNVLFVSYLWDDDPVDAPTARRTTVSKIACVWLERVGVEGFGSRLPFAEDQTLCRQLLIH